MEKNGLKVYIHFDLEGVAGVTFPTNLMSHSPLNTWHTQWQRQLSTDEVKAAIEGAKDAGATTIWINDKHYTGFNLFYEQFEPPVELIQGRGARQPTFMPGLDETWDALVFVGAFAKGGTWGACQTHQLWYIDSLDEKKNVLQHLEVGIFGVVATGAGYYNVPTVFVSGDDYVCREAAELIPGIETGVVKHSLGMWSARSVTPPAAQRIIRAGVAEGIYRRKEIKPVKLQGDYYRFIVGPEADNMWPDRAVISTDFLQGWEQGNNVLWSDFGNYHDDGYAWPDKIKVAADGKHTTQKRTTYDSESTPQQEK